MYSNSVYISTTACSAWDIVIVVPHMAYGRQDRAALNWGIYTQYNGCQSCIRHLIRGKL